MLAQSATSVAAALERTSPAAIDWKLDGARVQIHRQGADIRVFTRSLDDITSRVPELVEMARSLRSPARWCWTVRCWPCARMGGRTRSRSAPVGSVADWTSSGCAQLCHSRRIIFDILHLDGEDLIDQPLEERLAILGAAVPEQCRVPQS